MLPVSGRDIVSRDKFAVPLKSHNSVALNMSDIYLQILES